MIILSTAATGNGRATLSRGDSYSKKWKMGTEKWRNVRTEWRQRAQDLDQGEESFKWNWKHMKSVFFWCPNAHRLATSYKGTIRVRQAEREREGDSETTWEETKTTSLILPLQFSITKIVVTCKSDPRFRPFVGLSSAPSFVSISRQKTKDKRKKERRGGHSVSRGDPPFFGLASTRWCMSAKNLKKT